MVDVDIMKRVCDDFCHPNKSSLEILLDEQLNSPKQDSSKSQLEPGCTDCFYVAQPIIVFWQNSQKACIEVNCHWQQCPDTEQNYFALQVVAYLDFFLVFMGGLVHMIVTMGLKKEMPRLSCGHGKGPSHDCGPDWIDEQHHIRTQKGQGADEMQRLVDSAVVIEAMVIPTLFAKSFEELFHVDSRGDGSNEQG